MEDTPIGLLKTEYETPVVLRDSSNFLSFKDSDLQKKTGTEKSEKTKYLSSMSLGTDPSSGSK